MTSVRSESLRLASRRALVTGGLAALEQVVGDLLELGAGQHVVEVLGAGGVSGDEGQVDGGLLGCGELLLGVLGGLLQALQGHGVLAQVDAVVGLELVGHPVDDALVPVVAAQVVVARGGEHLEHAVGEVQDGDVEGAAAQVEHEDALVGAALVEAVGERRGGGLVDDALDVQAGDLAGVLGGLALGVVEVGRDGDDGVGDGLAEVLLGVGLHLLQDHRADLLGRVVLAVDLGDGAAALSLLDRVGDGLDLGGDLTVPAAHEALDGEDGVLGVGDGLVLGGLAHHAVAVGAEAHDGRGGAVALGVHDDGGVAALEDRHGGVGGTEVDTEDLAHWISLFFPFPAGRLRARARAADCSFDPTISPYRLGYTKSKSNHIRFLEFHATGSPGAAKPRRAPPRTRRGGAAGAPRAGASVRLRPSPVSLN